MSMEELVPIEEALLLLLLRLVLLVVVAPLLPALVAGGRWGSAPAEVTGPKALCWT